MKKLDFERTRRIGVLDICILFLLVLLVVGGIFLYAWRRGGDTGEWIVVRYTVRVYDLEEALLGEGALEEGDAVFTANGSTQLGFVESVELRPQRTAAVRDGEVVLSESPTYVCADVRVRCLASVKAGDGIRCEGVRIVAGESGVYRMGGLLASRATVILVEKEAEE